MDTPYTPFMRDLEGRFKQTTGFQNRAAYKIYYCQVRSARILTLGINPGGAPSDTSADGRVGKDGIVAAASSTFYENSEHDVLDCGWRENIGLRQILCPLVGGVLASIRTEVVKTNLAFHRSARRSDIEVEAAADQTAPFLREIIEIVNPSLILLTGVALQAFTSRFAKYSEPLVAPERDPGVKQVVFAAARASVGRPEKKVLIVQLAHASQFGWTYTKYDVAERISRLLKG